MDNTEQYPLSLSLNKTSTSSLSSLSLLYRHTNTHHTQETSGGGVLNKPNTLQNDTSIKDETDDSEEVETYRALLILSLDNEDIASLRITRFPDPGGLAFSRYVTGIFSDCDWFGREKELMISMGTSFLYV